MAEHSKTPWRFVTPDPKGWMGTGTILDADGKTVCDFGDCEQYYPPQGEPPSEADQEFILRAVNSHDALVEALNACLAYIPGSEVHNWPPGWRLRDAALRLARAALAKASPEVSK